MTVRLKYVLDHTAVSFISCSAGYLGMRSVALVAGFVRPRFFDIYFSINCAHVCFVFCRSLFAPIPENWERRRISRLLELFLETMS